MHPNTSNSAKTAISATPKPSDLINSAHWYLIYTKSRQEYRALKNLQQQAFEVYLPLLQSERLLRGKLSLVEEPLFKRYLFVRFNENGSPWHSIRNTFGVSELVRTGGQLAKVPAELVEALKQLQATPQALFQRGEALQVTDGPFRNLQAIFEMHDGDHRAIVLIELLNKIHKVTINLNALSKQD